MSRKVIGIDLGSTNSVVSIIEAGKPVVVVNEEGNRTTPSVIALKNGERKVGEGARRQRVVNPKETVSIIKRFMGATYEESKEAAKHVLYEIVDRGGMPRVLIEDREYSPEELSSFILAKLKKTAEDYVGEEIKDAVITVPAYFTEKAKAATKVAGEMAGMNVLRVINEPTAAILSANINTEKGDKTLLISDFGGCTTDFSVAELSDSLVEIKASKGDVFLGGADIDRAVSEYLVDKFKKENNIDLTSDAQAMQRIVEAAEKAKIELSNTTSTEVNLPYVTVKNGTPMHMAETLTRSKFESLIYPIIERVIKCGKESLEAAKIKASDLDGILLVGGSCRIPLLQEKLKETFGVELLKNVNLDECVSLGAAVQANIIVGGEGSSDILLLDVCSLSMGIETMGGVFTKLIEANTTIPCSKTEIFSTAVDNQPSVEINVLQGERPMARDNKQIGMFHLDGILPARRGTPQIEVKFDVDANGILSVSAKDKATNKEQSIRIETKGGLTQEEIDKIKKEAEQFAEQDKKEKEKVDKLNKLDSLSFQIDKQMEGEVADKLTDDEKKYFEDLKSKIKKDFEDKNIDNADEYEKEFNQKWVEISTKLYNSQQGSGNNNQSNPFGNMFSQGMQNGGFAQDPSSGKRDDKSTVNADYEEVK